MAAITIGSVGDIIALCSLVRTATRALSSTRGSAAEYHSLGRELWNLSQALLCVKRLLEQEPDLQYREELEEAVTDCHTCFVCFLQRIEAFECLGQNRDSRHSTKILYKKLRWPAYQVRLYQVYKVA